MTRRYLSIPIPSWRSRCKKIVKRMYIKGYSYDDMAKVIKKSTGTVYHLLCDMKITATEHKMICKRIARLDKEYDSLPNHFSPREKVLNNEWRRLAKLLKYHSKIKTSYIL